jgi:cobalt-zinc-cadmium efflux system membrane fusion protein
MQAMSTKTTTDTHAPTEKRLRDWLQRLPVRAASWLPASITLLLLGVLAVFGHQHDWKLPSYANLWGSGTADEKQDKDEDEGVKFIPDSDADLSQQTFKQGRIVFPSQEAVTRAGFRFATAQVRPMAQDVVAQAVVDYEPSLYANLSSRVTGILWRVEREMGDAVRKGEVLAVIDAKEVGQKKASLLESMVRLRLKMKTVESLEPLYQQGATSLQKYRVAEAELRVARITLFNDQQALLNLGLPIRAKELEAMSDEQATRHLRLFGLPEEFRKNLDTETMSANLLALTAPFDGRVVQRNAAPGEVVQPGQVKPLFVIGDTRQVHVHLNVKPADVGHLRAGQTVRFQPDLGGSEIAAARATIMSISPEVDEKTRRVGVHAHADNPDGRLRPNTYGTGRITVIEHPAAIAVPADAVQSEGNSHLVFIRLADKTSFRVQQVQPGLREGNLVEVNNVPAGAEVVTTGSFTLKSELFKKRIAAEE